MTRHHLSTSSGPDDGNKNPFRKFGDMISKILKSNKTESSPPTETPEVDTIAQDVAMMPCDGSASPAEAAGGESAASVDHPEEVVVALSSAPEHCPLLGPQRARDAGKPCLVLDLDETLVHSSFSAEEGTAPDFVVPFEFEGLQTTVYVRQRPYCDEFLKALSEHFELVVFTASIAVYADPLLDRIDPEHRIAARLYREHCVLWQGSYFIKDLSILGRPLEQTLILDNSAVSYLFQPENGLPCSSWYDDPHDTELHELVPFLSYIADKPNLGAAVRAALGGADGEAPHTPQLKIVHRAALKALEAYVRPSPSTPGGSSAAWASPQVGGSGIASVATQARRE